MKEAPTSADTDYLPGLIGALAFFGKSAPSHALVAGLPLAEGKLGASHLAEAAARADVLAVSIDKPARAVSRSELPVLAMIELGAEEGQVVALLARRGVGFVAARGDGEPFWLPEETLHKSASVIRLQPAFYYDQRSLQIDLDVPQEWFKGTLFANRDLYGFAILAGLFVNLAAIAISLFTMAVYDRVIPNDAMSSLVALLIGITVIVLVDMGLKSIRGYLVDAAGRRFDVSVGTRIFARLLTLRSEARPQSAGTLANVVREFETVRDFFTSATLVGLGDVPFVLLFLLIIWWIAGAVVLVPIVGIIVMVVAGLMLQKPLARAVARSFREGSQKAAFLHESAAGVDTIKAINAQSWARRQWEALISQSAETSLVSRQWSSLAATIAGGTGSFVTIGTVAFGAVLVAAGDITSGALIAATILAGRALAPFAQVSNLMARWQQTRLAVDALDKLMMAETEETPGQVQYVEGAGRVTLRDVSFTYPDPASQTPPLPALRNVSFDIAAGECVAIVGRVGSGKSTLLKLALNLHGPQSGNVLLDGVDVRQIHPAALRTAVGYAAQDAVLFFGSVRDNMLAACPGLDDEKLMQAARLAGLNDLLERSVHGLQTQVGEGGLRLSGGERQAVSLARALVGRPPVLLLDEPTSAMDHSTEHRVLQGLAEARAGLTTIIVTHKPALLSLASRIIVIDKGQVVMDDTRDKVLVALTPRPASVAPSGHDSDDGASIGLVSGGVV